MSHNQRTLLILVLVVAAVFVGACVLLSLFWTLISL